ncbi:hypothetical protein [Arthrobacter sp. H20]|uniref:hypothetical protein n=1 Tax=Arthrobacter sp. H20 TaxID=1267981 RepID=UPI00047AC8C6|nr:hypothetical protein [Arthrobacter sp. H20]
MNRSDRILTLALAFTLTGCTGSPALDSSDTPPVQNESSAATSPSPSASASPSASPKPSEITSSESPPPPEATGGAEDGESASPLPETPEPGTAQGRPVNEHGNLGETVGETSVFNDGSGTTFAEMEAEEIQVDFQCTGGSAQKSINGQFVALQFSVEAQPELVDSGWPYFAMSAREFRAWDADGQPVDDPVGNSAGCVDPDELLASPIEPGSDAVGLIVLDVPAGSGSASFTIGGFEGSYGWEWAW